MTLIDDSGPDLNLRQGRDVALCHKMECKVCPLADLPNLHPNMPASGAERPLIYVLAEAPGKQEDEQNRQLVGASGKLFRPLIPERYHKLVRYNNCVRTRPPGNRTPTQFELECCRPSVVRDIEQSKPRIIIGLGNTPLEWVSGFSTISQWRGRRMPVRIGTHTCWFYPTFHPAFLLRSQHSGKEDPEEMKRMFKLDLVRAFAELKDLPQPWVPTTQEVFKNIVLLSQGGRAGLDRIIKALEWAAAQPDIGFDYETDRLRPYHPEARILSVAIDNGKRGFAFPIDHPEAPWTKDEREELIRHFTDFLREAECVKYVHNLAFELEWTGVYFGREYVRAGKWEDSAAQAAILDERKGKSKPGCFSLEFLVQQYFGFNLKKLSNVNRAKLADLPMDVVLRYNGADARGHVWLGRAQKARIEADELEIPYQLALRRIPTVVLTQIKGVPVNQEEVKRLHKKYTARYNRLEKEIAEFPVVKRYERLKNQEFKPLSNAHVFFIMNEMLGFEECLVKNNYTGKFKESVDKAVLEQIQHPLAKKLIELRETNKRNSTYIKPLLVGDPSSVIHADGLIHAIFNTIFAETGRLSAQEPNLQNVPKRGDEAKEVRKQIQAARDEVILAFDYGQLEARVIAAATKDPAFCKALWAKDKYDVHMAWAKRIARAYPRRVGGPKFFNDKKVMKAFRTDIKNQWTFPLFFGAKLESVAGYLGIPPQNLKAEYEAFWKEFSGVKKWQDEQLKLYKEYGYVKCLTGRRRRGPMSVNQVINSPIQGTAAEIVMDAMCRLSEQNDWALQPNINIHDDLTWTSVPLTQVKATTKRIVNSMLAIPFKWAKIVPWSVELSIGPNWLELEEYGTFYSDTWDFNQ